MQILYFIVSPIIRSSTAWVVLTFQVYLGRFIYRKENTVQSYATRLLANNSRGIDLTWNRLLFFYWKYYVQIPNSFGSNLFNKTLFSRRNLCKNIFFFVMKQTSYDIFLWVFFLFISKRSMRCIVQVISFSCFSTFNKDKRKKNILLPPDPTVCFHLEILTVQVWSVPVWSVKIEREKKINQELVHYS